MSSVIWDAPSGGSLEAQNKFVPLGYTLRTRMLFPKNTGFHFFFEATYSYLGSISPQLIYEKPGSQYNYAKVNLGNIEVSYLLTGGGIGYRF